jgi:pyruvate kinase
VRNAADVADCRAEMEKAGRVVPIIAKIEKPEALDHLDAIIEAADGIMVARGDLGVEILPERVPGLQKQMLHKASAAGKPAIIATQMLESMIEHPRPTRAEASDVANAVWDGADAVMLSAESASGRFPLLAVQMMDRIVREAEALPGMSAAPPAPRAAGPAPIPEVIADTACRAAHESGAAAIACFTRSGSTARLISRQRPRAPVVAFSPDQSIRRRMALLWGVVPKVMEPISNPELMTRMVSERLMEDGMARPGERVVLVHGTMVGVAGHTNSIRLHRIPFPGEQRAEGE